MTHCAFCEVQSGQLANELPHPELVAGEAENFLERYAVESWRPFVGTFRCRICGSFLLRQDPGKRPHARWILAGGALSNEGDGAS